MMDLSEKKIVISTHIFVTGPAQDLRDYLTQNCAKTVFFIGHPLFYNSNLKGSGYDVYYEGEHVFKRYGMQPKYPKFLKYTLDFINSLWFILQTDDTWDLYVGCNNLNALAGIILKKLGKVKKTVFYVIDYNPHRWDSHIFNAIYHLFDRICVRNCDEVWNLSPRMEMGRKEYFNLKGGHQKVVPMGVWTERIQLVAPEAVNKHTLAFVGHIIQKQGIQHVVEAIPEIIKKYPDFKLLIVGTGDYLEPLQQQAKELKVAQYVDFKGYIENHEAIEQLLVRCGLGIALYDRYMAEGVMSFTYFSDPGKLKLYLACGLPVVVSDVPHNAQELVQLGCGEICSYTTESICEAICKIYADFDTYRGNVLKIRDSINWNLIFPRALENL